LFNNLKFEENKYNGIMMFYIGGIEEEKKDVWDELDSKAGF
jgi:hypothetical protein